MKLHSQIDLITNSSSEAFIIKMDAATEQEITERIQKAIRAGLSDLEGGFEIYPSDVNDDEIEVSFGRNSLTEYIGSALDDEFSSANVKWDER